MCENYSLKLYIDTDENPDLIEWARAHSLRNHKLRDRYNSTDYQTGRTQAEGPHAWSRAAGAKDDMHIQWVWSLRGCQKMGAGATAIRVAPTI